MACCLPPRLGANTHPPGGSFLPNKPRTKLYTASTTQRIAAANSPPKRCTRTFTRALYFRATDRPPHHSRRVSQASCLHATRTASQAQGPFFSLGSGPRQERRSAPTQQHQRLSATVPVVVSCSCTGAIRGTHRVLGVCPSDPSGYGGLFYSACTHCLGTRQRGAPSRP